MGVEEGDIRLKIFVSEKGAYDIILQGIRQKLGECRQCRNKVVVVVNCRVGKVGQF